jgi:FixJ family two-component response regulator
VIVLIDDDASVRRALSRLLRSAGFEVRTFGSAAELLDSGAAHNADCLLLDIQLGPTSGFELVDQLRAQGTTTPIVFMTAFDDEATRRRASLVQGSAYLRKPFQAAELLDRLSAANVHRG